MTRAINRDKKNPTAQEVGTVGIQGSVLLGGCLLPVSTIFLPQQFVDVPYATILVVYVKWKMIFNEILRKQINMPTQHFGRLTLFGIRLCGKKNEWPYPFPDGPPECRLYGEL